jgi:hypothetical protein
MTSSAARPVQKPAAAARPSAVAAVKAAGKAPAAKPAPKRIDPFDSDSGDDYPVLEVGCLIISVKFSGQFKGSKKSWPPQNVP